MSKGNKKKAPPTRKADIVFEFTSNLAGMLVYKCQCGNVCDAGDVDLHVINIHKATHMTIKSIPVKDPVTPMTVEEIQHVKD